MKHQIILSEQEDQVIGREMVSAAICIFQKLPVDIRERDQNDIAKAVVHALLAADSAQIEGKKKHETDDGWVYSSIDPAHAVATAFWIWHQDIELGLEEIEPSCIGGLHYLGFAQGLAAVQGMTQALNLLEEGSEYAFEARGARLLDPEKQLPSD